MKILPKVDIGKAINILCLFTFSVTSFGIKTSKFQQNLSNLKSLKCEKVLMCFATKFQTVQNQAFRFLN